MFTAEIMFVIEQGTAVVSFDGIKMLIGQVAYVKTFFASQGAVSIQHKHQRLLESIVERQPVRMNKIDSWEYRNIDFFNNKASTISSG